MENADPIVFVGKLLAIFIGVQLATLVAPHVVIIVAGAIGATFGLMGWRECTRLQAAGYVAAFTGAAWLFAGLGAEVVASVWHVSDTTRLLAPASAGIAWIGHRWPDVGGWAVGLLKKAIERKAEQ